MATATSAEKVSKYIESLQHSAEAEEFVDEEFWIAELAEPEAAPNESEATTLGLVELLLKNQTRLDRLARKPNIQRELVPRLLGIGLIGYTLFGIALVVVFNSARIWPELTSLAAWLESNVGLPLYFASEAETSYAAHWFDGSALKLVAAFTLGLIGAIGVCLPTFYFYGLLAGVRTSMLQVTTLALKGMASSAVALVGMLPIYFAAVLGLLVLNSADWLVGLVCFVGLSLPFIAGLYGTYSLYRGFVVLADTLSDDRRERRECFLRRLLLAWSVCFTAVTPLMIFTLWEYLNR
jgi:hypothetical protein